MVKHLPRKLSVFQGSKGLRYDYLNNFSVSTATHHTVGNSPDTHPKADRSLASDPSSLLRAPLPLPELDTTLNTTLEHLWFVQPRDTEMRREGKNVNVS